MTENEHQGVNVSYRAAIQAVAIIAISTVVAFTFNHFRENGLKLIGNWSEMVSGDMPTVSIQEAEALFTSGGAFFLDARSHEDYAEGHIRGALSLPWHEVERRFIELADQLPTDKIIITYCDGEVCSLSRDLAAFLMDSGFMNIRILVNGWSLWRDHNLPVESD